MLAKTSSNGRLVYEFAWDSNDEYLSYFNTWLLGEAIGTALAELQRRIAERISLEPYTALGDT